jgi:hypothetical protein
MEKLEKLRTVLASIEVDAVKFYSKSNYAAGTRVRKAMQVLKVLASEIRAEIQTLKHSK